MNKKSIYRNMVAVLCFLCLFLTSGVISAQAASPSVEFSAHVQGKGWLDYVKDGNIAGTVGEELQMEAIKIHLKNASGKIWYKVYVQDAGWQDWVSNDKVAGTEGKSKRIEAIKIQITGDIYDTYDVFYRAHVGNIGWLGWTKNGGIAGTMDVGTRMEAVQIVLKKKDQPEKMSTSYATKPALKVNSHVQGKGWLGYVGEGETSGTEGQSLRMEALNIICPDLFGGSGITYRAHVQNVGWQNWVSSGESVGTTGQSKSMEAVQIQLAGYLTKFYDIYYRAHVRDIGWMGWAKNGEFAGTTGGSKPMEAIQVKLLIKGDIINRGGDAYKDLTAQETDSPSSNEENQNNYAKVPVSSNKPIICYTLNSSGKIYAYTSAALTKKTGGYIACSTDECRILQVQGNAVQVKYPVKKGTKTAWFQRSAFTNCNIANDSVKTWKQASKVTVYRRLDGNKSFGSISTGDTCYELSISGNYIQLIYPVSGGYKMGWIKTNNDIVDKSNIQIAGVTLDYALGSYFTDNGRKCTNCHGKHTGNYTTNENYCNCKCTATINGKTYKLGAIQCFGFARYVQSALYATNSYLNPNAFSRTKSVSYSDLTVSKLKTMIVNAGVGAHIRTGGSQHSMIITQVTDSGFTIIQCNGSNNNNYSSYAACRIGTTTYTWDSYINSTYGKRGIAFIETYKG